MERSDCLRHSYFLIQQTKRSKMSEVVILGKCKHSVSVTDMPLNECFDLATPRWYRKSVLPWAMAWYPWAHTVSSSCMWATDGDKWERSTLEHFVKLLIYPLGLAQKHQHFLVTKCFFRVSHSRQDTEVTLLNTNSCYLHLPHKQKKKKVLFFGTCTTGHNTSHISVDGVNTKFVGRESVRRIAAKEICVGCKTSLESREDQFTGDYVTTPWMSWLILKDHCEKINEISE